MICASKSCNNKFEPKTHNQKYCSDECCKIATNLKIKEKYNAKKDRLAGKKRICKNKGCTSELGRYNEGDVCGGCVSKQKEMERQEILAILNGAS
jgi:hypothetical protein